jgi:hypothetical protein
MLNSEFKFPKIINLNVWHGQCPCQCAHCPIGITPLSNRADRFGYGQMKLSLYSKIVDEIRGKKYASVLRIHGVGEPILWRNLLPAVLYSSQHQVKTWLFTCAVTEDYGLLCKLCELTNIIEVSVNSYNKDDYVQTKGIDAFAQVKSNIKLMHDHIVNKKLPVRLIVSRVASGDKITNQLFIEYWKDSGLVADAFVRSYHNYNQLLSCRSEEVKPNKKPPCLVHWARFNVHVDGRAVICFNELFKERLNPDLVLGDLRCQTVEEIWNGQQLNMIRQAELKSDYSLLSYQESIPCKNCCYCQPLWGSQDTSENQIDQLALK